MDSTGSSADATQATAADTQASDPWEVAFPADAIGVEESGGSGGPPAPEEHVMVSQEGDVGGPPESEVAALAPTGCSGGCGTSAADDEDMWFAAADIPRPISPPAVFGETADYAMTTGGSGGSSTPAPAEGGAGDMGGISGPVLSPSSGTGDGLGFTNPITEETGDSSGIAQLIPHGGGHGGSGEPGPWEMEWASAPEEAVASTATAPGESSDIQLELPQPSATTSDFVAMFENAAEPGEPMADLTSPATGATASNEVEDDSANAGTAWSAAFGNDALEGESGGSGSPMPDSGTGDVGGISGPSVSPACETGAGPGDVGGISSSAADWPSQPGESAGSIRGAESGDVGGISDAAIDWPSQPGEGAGPVHGIESGAGSGEPGFWEGEASADGARDADFDFSSAPAAAVTASPSPNAAGGLDGMVFDGEFQEEPVEPVAETGQAAVEDFGDFGSFDGPGASVDASPPAAQEEAPQPAQSFADFAADFAADFQPAAAPESNETFGGSSASAAPAGQDPPKASAFNFGDESSDEGPGDVGGISTSADWPSQPGESKGTAVGPETGDVGGISDSAIDWPSPPGESPGNAHGVASGAGSGEPGFWEGEAKDSSPKDDDFDFSSAPPVADVDLDAAAPAVSPSPSPTAGEGFDAVVLESDFQEAEAKAATGQPDAEDDFGDFEAFGSPGAAAEAEASPPAAQEEKEAPQSAESFAADFAADFQPAAAPESNETFGGSSASAAPAGQDPPKASAFNFGDESSDEGPGDVGGISTSADWPSQPGESKGTAVGPETGDVGGISDSAIDWPSPPGESPGNAHGVASGAGSGEPGFWEGEAKDSSPKDDDFDFSSAPPVADVDLDAAAPAVSPSPSPTAGEGFDAVVLESDFQAEGKGATGQPDAEDDFGDFEAFEGPGAAAEAEASPPAAQEEKAPQLSDDFDAEFEDFQPAAPPPETNETFGGSSASAAPAGPPAPKASDFKFGDESSEEGESGGAARSTEVAAAASPAEPAPAQAQDDDDDFFDDDDFEFSSAPTAAAEPPPVSEPVASAERGFNDVQFDGDLSSSTRRLLERWCSDVAQTGKCPLLQKCSPSSADPVSDLEDALRLCIPPATLQLITTGSEFYGKVSGIAAGTPCRFSDAVWEDSCAISCTGAVKAVYMTTLGRFMQITKGAPEQDGDAVGGASAGPVSQSDGLDVDILGADRSQAAASVHPSGPSAAPRGELGGMDADWSIFAAPASQDAGAGGASTSAMDFAGFQAPVPAPTAPAPPASAAASDPLFMFGLAEPPAPSAPPSGAEDGMTDRVRAYLKSLPNLAHLSATTIVAS